MQWLQTKSLNPSLSPLILPSAVLLGGAMWCPTPATFPWRGGCCETEGGSMGGTPHLAPERLFHPRNTPVPGETEPFHAAASVKGSVIPVLHTSDLTMKLFSPNRALVGAGTGNRPHISFSWGACFNLGFSSSTGNEHQTLLGSRQSSGSPATCRLCFNCQAGL